MLVNYRGHVITVLEGAASTAQLTDLYSGTLLPTKVTINADEGIDVLLERAKELIDLYLASATAPTRL